MRIRTTGRIRDSRVEDQIREIQRQGDESPLHAEMHYRGGRDELKPSDIGAETPSGAQQKAETEANKVMGQAQQLFDQAQQALTSHADQSNPHFASQAIQGGSVRPVDAKMYEMFFDADLNKPIWWNGSGWVDAAGTLV